MRNFLRIAAFVLLLISWAAAQTVTTFEGIDASTPGNTATLRIVDPNGAVGTKQYLEWIDTAYQGYNKTTFAPVFSPLPAGDTPWLLAGETNCEGTAGNGVAIFDRLALRWVIALRQGSTKTQSYFFCVAVSNTDDLAASNFAWNAYAIPLNNLLGTNSKGTVYFPDYPKIATWLDAYYLTIDLEDQDNNFQEVGVLVCALDRANMLVRGTARNPQCFRYPAPPTGSLFLGHSLYPADIEGPLAPPPGTPETFVSIENPHNTNTSGLLNFWTFDVNWTTPSLTTFTGPKQVNVPAYVPGCYDVVSPTNTVCVPEPTTATTNNYIDSVGDRLMHRFAYRRFTTAPFQTYLVSHAVQVGSASKSQTGIRWYEFTSAGSLLNSGTISPADSNYRFVPSVAQDSAGNLAVGYSVSGASTHPRIAASYLNLRGGNSTPTEITLFSGTADEENAYHWGGYTSMTVDPADDCTFWYVNQYYTIPQLSSVTWQTRISNFKLPTCTANVRAK